MVNGPMPSSGCGLWESSKWHYALFSSFPLFTHRESERERKWAKLSAARWKVGWINLINLYILAKHPLLPAAAGTICARAFCHLIAFTRTPGQYEGIRERESQPFLVPKVRVRVLISISISCLNIGKQPADERSTRKNRHNTLLLSVCAGLVKSFMSSIV